MEFKLYMLRLFISSPFGSVWHRESVRPGNVVASPLLDGESGGEEVVGESMGNSSLEAMAKEPFFSNVILSSSPASDGGGLSCMNQKVRIRQSELPKIRVLIAVHGAARASQAPFREHLAGEPSVGGAVVLDEYGDAQSSCQQNLLTWGAQAAAALLQQQQLPPPPPTSAGFM